MTLWLRLKNASISVNASEVKSNDTKKPFSQSSRIIMALKASMSGRPALSYLCGDGRLIKPNNFNVFRQILISDNGCPSPSVVSKGQTPESYTLNQNFLANGRQFDFIMLCDFWHISSYILPRQTTTRRFLAVTRGKPFREISE
jgi:hypothetical protein